MSNRKAFGMTRRERYEAQQRRRSMVIAATSTITVLAALYFLVPLAPGWAKVQQSFFNGEVLVKTYPKLLEAFRINVMGHICQSTPKYDWKLISYLYQ